MGRTLLMLLFAGCAIGVAAETDAIDPGTLDRWSAPYRGWHYRPDHVIPAKPQIAGHEAFANADCPTVFQLQGSKTWYMSFIAFDGKGYNLSVVWNPANETFYMHYCACGPKGRGIGLITSKPLAQSPR